MTHAILHHIKNKRKLIYFFVNSCVFWFVKTHNSLDTGLIHCVAPHGAAKLDQALLPIVQYFYIFVWWNPFRCRYAMHTYFRQGHYYATQTWGWSPTRQAFLLFFIRSQQYSKVCMHPETSFWTHIRDFTSRRGMLYESKSRLSGKAIHARKENLVHFWLFNKKKAANNCTKHVLVTHEFWTK
jgi:hypothetical protein